MIRRPPISTLFPYPPLFRPPLGPPVTRPASTRARASSSTKNAMPCVRSWIVRTSDRSEEHTSELQSRQYLVCRLLLEKKKQLWNRIVLYSSADLLSRDFHRY